MLIVGSASTEMKESSYLSEAFLLTPVFACTSFGKKISESSVGECAGSRMTWSWLLTYCRVDWNKNWFSCYAIHHDVQGSRKLNKNNFISETRAENNARQFAYWFEAAKINIGLFPAFYYNLYYWSETNLPYCCRNSRAEITRLQPFSKN